MIDYLLVAGYLIGWAVTAVIVFTISDVAGTIDDPMLFGGGLFLSVFISSIWPMFILVSPLFGLFWLIGKLAQLIASAREPW